MSRDQAPPRVLIAGPQSGSGKTTVTLGLLGALAERGIRAQPFKVGPDFSDAGLHAALTGRPTYHLDGWLAPEERLAGVFLQSMRGGAAIGVADGMAGLYDGEGAGRSTSSAEIARRLALPVLLVLDVADMTGSAGAAALGYRLFDPELQLAGIVLNRVSGERHLAACQDSLRKAGLRVLGAVPAKEAYQRVGGASSEERSLSDWARAIGAHLDLEGILTVARGAPALEAPRAAPWADRARGAARRAGERPLTIAVARDVAFGPYYQDTVDSFAAAGAEVVPFAPTQDESLPRQVAGLYLGGGWPARHLDALEANLPLRQEIARKAGAGLPIYGEGGGLLVLCRSLAAEGGARGGPRRAMIGVFDAHARMSDRPAIAYADVEVLADTPLAPAGTRLRGQVLRQAVIEPGGSAQLAYRLDPGPGIRGREDGFLVHEALGSVAHLALAAYPELVDRWLTRCAAYRARRIERRSAARATREGGG
jgi:cobyrinic acid a,c-diamide synthase